MDNDDDEFGPLGDVDECNIDEDADGIMKSKPYEELYKDKDAFNRIQELRILDKQLEQVDVHLNFHVAQFAFELTGSRL